MEKDPRPDNFPFPFGEYHNHGEIFDSVTETIQNDSSAKRRGGPRPGAGRKRKYTNPKRLKCEATDAPLANAFIAMLDKVGSKKRWETSYASRLDNECPSHKGGLRREYTDADAITSRFHLNQNPPHLSDELCLRLFHLAYNKVKPEYISDPSRRINGGYVTLTWSDPLQLPELFEVYGNLKARANRLTSEEKEALERIEVYY